MTHVLLDIVDGIGTVTLNRPEKLNAMNGQMMAEIDQVLAELRTDVTTRFVILTGAGRAFTSGADIAGRGAVPPGRL